MSISPLQPSNALITSSEQRTVLSKKNFLKLSQLACASVLRETKLPILFFSKLIQQHDQAIVDSYSPLNIILKDKKRPFRPPLQTNLDSEETEDTITTTSSFKEVRWCASHYLSELELDCIPRNLQNEIQSFLPHLKQPINLRRDTLFEFLFNCLMNANVDTSCKKRLYQKLSAEMQERIQKEFPYETGVLFLKFGKCNPDLSIAITNLLRLLPLSLRNQYQLMQILPKYSRYRVVPFALLLHLKTLTDADFLSNDLDGAVIGSFIRKAHRKTLQGIAKDLFTDDEEFDSHWPSFFFLHPAESRIFLDVAAGKTLIEFFYLGRSKHNYAEVQRFLLTRESKRISAVKMKLDNGSASTLTPIKWAEFNPSGATVYGRTIVTQCDVGLLCCKFKRSDENSVKFRSEALILEQMLSRQDLLSDLPKPLGVFSYDKYLPKWVLDAKVCTGEIDGEVYVYIAKPGYFTYIQDGRLDQKVREKARHAWLHDMGSMGRDGYYFDAAPIFHNNLLTRTYLPLPDCKVGKEIIKIGNGGAGRLDSAFKDTKYPNVGATGARDFADIHCLTTLRSQPEPLSWDIKFHVLKGRIRNDYLEGNLMARVLLVDALLLVSTIKNQNRLDWQNSDLIDETAQALSDGAARFLHGYIKKDFEECRRFVSEGLIDWKLAARQLLFWSQNDENGYLPYVKKLSLPNDLYRFDVVISLKNNAVNFDPKIGYNTHGEQDFGPYNGPWGLDELERFLNFFTAFAMALK